MIELVLTKPTERSTWCAVKEEEEKVVESFAQLEATIECMAKLPIQFCEREAGLAMLALHAPPLWEYDGGK
jgi:hypothetical protein